MQIKMQPMGVYQTNCYILYIEDKEFIVDPGVGASEWVMKNVRNPIAVLNTHGHFDHIWSNSDLQKRLKVKIYAPKDDVFMLQSDPLGQGTPPCKVDYGVDHDEEVEIEGVKFLFRHFPGHTPGCSVIEKEGVWFSGDFLFHHSIGRWDFPASSAKDMVSSLKKAMKIKDDYILYPGHGPSTTLKEEQKVIPFWIKEVQDSIKAY